MEDDKKFTSNLLSETCETLRENDKVPADVRWVGDETGRFAVTWEQFATLADFEYDAVRRGLLLQWI